MVKIIKELYEKADEIFNNSESYKGSVVDQKGAKARINGRKSYYYGHKGELEEKYSIIIIRVNGSKMVLLSHWGTNTLVVNADEKKILRFYGESVSDRNSMNTLLEILGVEGKFRYFPSTETFQYEDENMIVTV